VVEGVIKFLDASLAILIIEQLFLYFCYIEMLS
jgi:hypothetical protein